MTSRLDSESKVGVIRFDAKEIGMGLKEVASDFVRIEEKDVESRWFHSSKDADLFLWKDENQSLIKFQVSFFGTIVEWNIIEGVRTGLMMEDEGAQVKNQSPVIRFDATPSRHSVEQGVEILGYVVGLKDQDKVAMIENLARNTVFGQLSVEEILKRFHPSLSGPASIWLRLMKALGFQK